MRTLKISEYPKRGRIKSDGTAPITFKIKANGTASIFNTNAFVNPERWDETNGLRVDPEKKSPKDRVVKLNAEENDIRFYLDSIKKKLIKIEDDFIDSSEFYSAALMRDRLLKKGSGDNSYTILQLWDEHKKNFSRKKESYEPYNSTRKMFEAFLKEKIMVNDFLVKKVDDVIQRKFHSYLTTKIGANTTHKYLTLFRAVIKWGQNFGFIKDIQLNNLKLTKKEKVHKTWLTLDEIKVIASKEFKIESMRTVRDYFLFSCLTGYSYADTYALTPANMLKEKNDWFIIKNREKTGNKCDVYLTKEARNLIIKYEDNLVCIVKNKLFPMLSNAKTNQYLKLIADACGIGKRLTYHVARNSFARIMSQNGTMTNELQDVLGHERIQQTKEYIGQMDNSQIKKVMKKMEGMFSSN